MKLSLNWIKDYVKIPDNMDLSEFAYQLTMSTVEVEGAHDIAKGFDHIVVGEILTVNPHPNADKLRVCSVNTGDEAPHDIVCGGSNLAPGMKVVVAAPGAWVRWHGEGEPVEIKAAKLRGVPSYGMICGADEVGISELFPPKDDHEIVDLSDFDVTPGQNVAVALGLDDIILEIDNKSMTNRPDLWGHYGMAREIAALYDLELLPIDPYTPPAVPAFDVRIEDTHGCPRYIGVKMEGLSVKPAPFALRARLWKVGLRPINALVDITNYVMMAVGQPTHAFDSDMIENGIRVRRAAEGEALSLLNGKELVLHTDDLVIADDKEAVALAGVMGGSKDSILPTTKNVILEVANFESTGIRRTALRYDNRTDSSTRYEKAIDPERCDLALSIAMELFAELYPDMKVVAYADSYPEKLSQAEIDVSYNWLDRRLGKHLTPDEISHKLGLLGFRVSFDGDNMHVVVPTWRSTGDVSIKADIMEEVARMYGYENFQASTITTSHAGAINQLDKTLVRRIEEYLAYRCGMQEILTYPWMKEEFVTATLGSVEGILTLPTPPSPEEKYLRSSTLPNLVQAVVKNERYYTEFSLFEEAQIFDASTFVSPYDETEKLPRQRRHIGCAFAEKTEDTAAIAALFRRVKGIFEYMPAFTHMEAFTFEKAEKPVWADHVAWLNIKVGDAVVGHIGVLDKRASMAAGIKNLTVILAELDTDALIPFKSRTNTFTHLAEYPVVDYDISMLVDAATTWEAVRSVVLSKQRDFLKGVTFVEEYKGKQIPEGKKSLTIRLAVGADDRTLTSDAIEACAAAVIKQLAKELGAEIRGK